MEKVEVGMRVMQSPFRNYGTIIAVSEKMVMVQWDEPMGMNNERIDEVKIMRPGEKEVIGYG